MKLLQSLGYTVEVAARDAGFGEKSKKESFLFHDIPFSRESLSFANVSAFGNSFPFSETAAIPRSFTPPIGFTSIRGAVGESVSVAQVVTHYHFLVVAGTATPQSQR